MNLKETIKYFHILTFLLLFSSILSNTRASNPEKWWDKINGARMFYLQITDHTFKDIEDNLDDIYNKGYRIISFYCVYDGLANAFAGLGPIDFYKPQRSAGTMEDFESLSAAVHAKGMRILSWINLAYSTYNHPYWIKAQEDKRDGIDSKEARSFRWADSDPTPNENCSGEECFDWAKSDIADKWYKLSWGYPAFDWASSDWQNEAKSILEFWHNKGIDGWVLDAGEFIEYENFGSGSILKNYIGDICTNSNVIVISEGSNTSPSWATERNFLYCYDDKFDTGNHDFMNVATKAISAQDASRIEPHLLNKVDICRENGGGSFSYDPERSYFEDSLRPLEVALMTSVGIMYELFFSRDWDNPNNYGQYTDDIETVIKAVNSTTALEPGGSRLFLSNDQRSVYTILKSSMDSTNHALCIFNFSSEEQHVNIDLSNSDIAIGQKPLNLIDNSEGPEITNSTYFHNLKAYEYLLYSIEVEDITSIRNETRGSTYQLKQNYPNPFNPFTSITYSVSSKCYVEMKLYSIMGEKIDTLVEEVKSAGIHTFDFDGSDLASGVYLYSLSAGSFNSTKKMTLLK